MEWAAYLRHGGKRASRARGEVGLHHGRPSWDWHDHGCESDEPMIWMDGLDLPLVGDLDATFFEMYPDHRFPISGTIVVTPGYRGRNGVIPCGRREYRWRK